MDENLASFTIDEQNPSCLHCRGNWVGADLADVEKHINRRKLPNNITQIDVSAIDEFDTVGAYTLMCLQQSFARDIALVGASDEVKALLALVQDKRHTYSALRPAQEKNPVTLLGKIAVTRFGYALSLLAFIGEIWCNIMRLFSRRSHMPMKQFFATIEITGVQALPIVGLLTFLVGVVLSYQVSLELNKYGAGIFSVELIGLAILREFGPLIAAIIVAGRTGSAYTAELGAMKINEEVDALRTFGLSPNEYLVLPKLLGLLVTFPLLAVWADMFGVLGGMIMSKGMLHLSYYEFLSRFAKTVAVKTYFIGLIKTPVFAFVIAAVGCYRGFQVTQGATSVGRQTTLSVVQAIFLIIIIDAVFSIIFSWRGM